MHFLITATEEVVLSSMLVCSFVCVC